VEDESDAEEEEGHEEEDEEDEDDGEEVSYQLWLSLSVLSDPCDIETWQPKPKALSDPFLFRVGLDTDDELSHLPLLGTVSFFMAYRPSSPYHGQADTTSPLLTVISST
jgi:hypothetical protein